MAEIIELANNLITPQDHDALEAFGGHEISHGRATRYDWKKQKVAILFLTFTVVVRTKN